MQCLYGCNIDQNDTKLVITYVVNDIIGSLIFINYAVWLPISSLIIRKIKKKTIQVNFLWFENLETVNEIPF